jgi:formylglycine-generating enzyme required for sulfatase activity
VENVSWDDAGAFCGRLDRVLSELGDLHARLPSEAEWEYACRAGTTTALYGGKELTSESGACPNLDELAWYDKNSGNWLGEDRYRVYRGGGWANHARDCRCACRDSWVPGNRFSNLGFRLVLAPKVKEDAGPFS